MAPRCQSPSLPSERESEPICTTGERRSTINLIDFNPDLIRDEDHAQAFVTNPDQALGDCAVAVVGANHGEIISGDGAVLGNGNTVNNGDVRATPEASTTART